MTVTETPDARRKPKNPERTRSEILQAALEEFAARGFDAATVRDIAARIGVSHGMIRYHYETKEKLWFAAVEFLFTRLSHEVSFTPEERARLDRGDLDVFKDWLRKFVRYCAKHPEHTRILIQESVSPSPRLEEVMRRFVRGPHQAAFEMITRMKKGEMLSPELHPVSLIYVLIGACQTMFALSPEVRYTLDYDPLSEEAVEAHADTIIALFFPLPQA